MHSLVLSIARATSFTAIAIDGGLQLCWCAEVLLLAFVWIQVLHVSERCIKLLIKEKQTGREGEREKKERRRRLSARKTHRTAQVVVLSFNVN